MQIDMISPAFEDGDDIPTKYTADGENINPPLIISSVPDDAVSLVLIVDDPDSPSGDFVHWLVWNINPSITRIEEGMAPEDAIEGYNDFEVAEYSGPKPPRGEEHVYQFKLFALDIELELDEDVTRDKVEKEMAGHILDEVILTGVYGRE